MLKLLMEMLMFIVDNCLRIIRLVLVLCMVVDLVISRIRWLGFRLWCRSVLCIELIRLVWVNCRVERFIVMF